MTRKRNSRRNKTFRPVSAEQLETRQLLSATTGGSLESWYTTRQAANFGRVNNNLINHSEEQHEENLDQGEESRNGTAEDLGIVTGSGPVEIDPTTVGDGTFDVYIFETQVTGTADSSIDLFFSHDDVDVDAYLFEFDEFMDDDNDSGLIDYAISVTDNESISLDGLAADTYILLVEAYDGTGEYYGQIQLAADDGFVYEEGFGVLNGRIEYQDVMDANLHVFEFTLGEEGNADSEIIATFDSAYLDFDMILFDSDFEVAGESLGVTSVETISMDGLAAGDYVLATYAYSGSGDYTLILNHESATQVDPEDPGVPVQQVSGVARTSAGRQADHAFVESGELISVSPNYSTSDMRGDLVGLGLQIHFDSRYFNYSGMSRNDVHGFTASQQFADTFDLDNDASTDSYISVLWVDIQADWPGTSAPVELTPVMFDVAAGLEDGARSTINFTSNQTAPGYGFAAETMTFEIGTPDNDTPMNLLDVDGDGAALPLTDGVLMLRHFAGFTGSALTNGAVSSSATRTSAGEISSFLNAAEGQLDVDDDGQSQPLSDGIMLIRHLAGFSGEALVSGALTAHGTRTNTVDIQDFLESREAVSAYGMMGYATRSASAAYGELDELFASPFDV